MQFNTARKAAAATLVAAFCLLFVSAPAAAAGTLLVRQANGSVTTYDNTKIQVLHGALYVTSADGKGTLVFHKAACSFQGKLMVCFPTSMTMIQSGKTTPLDLKAGTLYFNDTDEPQPLVLSSTKVPAHSMMLSLTTDRGTYVSLNGRIDSVVK